MKKIFDPFSALTFLDPRSLKYMSSQIMVLIETKLWAKVLFGMFLGVLFGIGVSSSGPFSEFLTPYSGSIDTFMNWLALPAKFFLKIIRMVIIPLIFASIIRGLASTTDVKQMKSLGMKFTLFVLINTTIAAVLGILLTTLIRPGVGLSLKGALAQTAGDNLSFSISPDSILNFLPLNPLASLVEGQMLDVVVLSIIAGIALLSIEKNQAKSILNMMEIIQQVCMNIISWAMKLAPYAVFGMISQVTANTGIKALQSMGKYITASFLGFILFVLFYAFLVVVFKRKSPLEFLKNISTALLLAFSTSSSAATMPVSMKIAEEELKVDPPVARFLIPLGATVNMAGSAIWQTSAIVFLSQAYDVKLTIGQITFVVATSIASAVGSPGVPGVGIGVLSAVLAKVGIPIEGVSLIMGVDRLIDMGCTVVNVAGDLTAVKIFSKK